MVVIVVSDLKIGRYFEVKGILILNTLILNTFLPILITPLLNQYPGNTHFVDLHHSYTLRTNTIYAT